MGGGGQKFDIFGGMKILWIFLGGHDKIGLVLVSLLCILGSFLKENVPNENTFALQKIQILFGVLDIPNFFGGTR